MHLVSGSSSDEEYHTIQLNGSDELDDFSFSPSFSSPPPLSQPNLNKWYVTDPQAEANRYSWWALGAKTLAAITFVAAIALASSIVIFAFLAASGTAIPLGFALGSAAGALLVPVSAWLRMKGAEYSAREENERRIYAIYEGLSQSEDNLNLKPFLQACGIQILPENIQSIQNKLPVEPTSEAYHVHLPSYKKAHDTCLLVLARFLHACEHAHRIQQEYPSPKADPARYRDLNEAQRIVQYQRYWKAREEGIYRCALNAIMMRAILANPFMQESTIEEFGEIHKKSYDLRKLDKKMDEDVYLSKGDLSISMAQIKPVKKLITSYEGLDRLVPSSKKCTSEELDNLQDALFELRLAQEEESARWCWII